MRYRPCTSGSTPSAKTIGPPASAVAVEVDGAAGDAADGHADLVEGAVLFAAADRGVPGVVAGHQRGDPAGIEAFFGRHHALVEGGGIVGDVSAVEASASYAKVYDATNTEFQDLATSSAGTDITNDYQFWSDTKADDDAVYFGGSVPFFQIYIDMGGTVQNYTGDALTWEYWDGRHWQALSLNAATERILGVPAADVRGKTWSQLLPACPDPGRSGAAAYSHPAGADLAACAARSLDQFIRLEAELGCPRRGRSQDYEFAVFANVRGEDALRLFPGEGLPQGADQAAHVAGVAHDIAQALAGAGI